MEGETISLNTPSLHHHLTHCSIIMRGDTVLNPLQVNAINLQESQDAYRYDEVRSPTKTSIPC